jgi:uncharacterized protein (DUF885 family)
VGFAGLQSQNPEIQLQRLNDVLVLESDYNKSQQSIYSSSWSAGSEVLETEKVLFQSWLDSLNNINAEELDAPSKITYDFLQLVVEDRFDQIVYMHHLIPLNSEGGFLTSMFYSMQYYQMNDERDDSLYLEKLIDTPRFLKEQVNYLKQGLKENIIVPKLVVNNCLKILNHQLEKSDSNHFLVKPAIRSKRDNTINKALAIYTLSVKPAFEEFKQFLEEEYLPNTRDEVGIINNSNGKSFYEQRVRYYTTLDMSPQEVFDRGMSEVNRIRAEMNTIISELQFEGSFDDFLNFLRTDTQFYVNSPSQLLHYASWLSKQAEAFLPRYFEQLPRMPFTVKPVPDDIAPTYTAGRYSGGSYSQDRPGAYWVNTFDLKSRPLYLMPALTLHEAVPGHHLQGSLAQEMEDVPEIRNRTYISAYGEGWALYCEYLGKEAGYYQSLYEEFGRLSYEMWRACRLVVDPGMHYFNWTREEAIDFMASNTALSMHEVNTEIDRYIGWPGQAVSYKIGELKIRALRKRTEEKLGDQFDIQVFHNKILENGSVPLMTLESIINSYIEIELSNEKN